MFTKDNIEYHNNFEFKLFSTRVEVIATNFKFTDEDKTTFLGTADLYIGDDSLEDVGGRSRIICDVDVHFVNWLIKQNSKMVSTPNSIGSLLRSSYDIDFSN